MTRTSTNRLRRFTAGTAAAAALASGIAFAFFLDSETYTGNTAVGGEITLTSSLATPLVFDGVDGRGLYPTDNTASGSGDVDSFSITNGNDVTVAYNLTAADNSTTTAAQQQFNELYVRIYNEGSTSSTPILGSDQPDTIYYEGMLKDLVLDSAIILPAQSGETFYNIEVFLLETGAEQAQGVTSTFSLTLDATTTPSERASQLDG